jgi:hypothetical protein
VYVLPLLPEEKNRLKTRDTNFRRMYSSFLALMKVTEFHSAYSCSNLFLKFDK